MRGSLGGALGSGVAVEVEVEVMADEGVAVVDAVRGWMGERLMLNPGERPEDREEDEAELGIPEFGVARFTMSLFPSSINVRAER